MYYRARYHRGGCVSDVLPWCVGVGSALHVSQYSHTVWKVRVFRPRSPGLFEASPGQQGLESGIGMQVIKAGIHFQSHDPHVALLINTVE